MFANNSELAPLFKLLEDEQYTQLALMFFGLISWSLAMIFILFGPVNNRVIRHVGIGVPILQEEPPA